jgi:signal transduction histidine kinase
MKKVLIIEDDLHLVELLHIHLTDMGCQPVTALLGKEGLQKAVHNSHDLIVLDIMLPDLNGLDICKQIRNQGIRTPILMLSAKSEEIDKVLDLELGADDYLTKPFSIHEFIARVKVIFRRSESQEQSFNQLHTGILTLGDVYIDPEKRKVLVKGIVVELTPKEFDLLWLVASHAGYSYSPTAVIEKGTTLVGYIYVVLAGEAYDATIKNLLYGHVLGLATQTMLITLPATLLIGLGAFRLITRNLKAIIDTVEKFHKGDLQSRIKVNTRDEFALLARTFNQMADTLAGNLEELKTAEALRRELIANVSHDLRTPIAAIQGYAETLMMKNESLTNADRERYTGIILQSSEKLRKLVDELFELSKLEASQSKPYMEVFNVAELVGEVFVQYRILARPKYLSVSYTSSQAAILVCADIGMIERVMQNLIDNAIKYTPENGSITIQVDIIQRQVLISVANTGPGIPASQLPHLFSRYATANPDKSPPSGMGLGLMIVKRILDLHSFPISVENTTSGETRFTFQLPLHLL